MPDQMTLREVLEEAIKKEMMSRFLYISLRQRVKNKASKDAFQCLAEQEEVHQSILEEYLGGDLKQGSLNTDTVVDYQIAEHLDQSEISPTMEIKDVFALAAKKEKAAHDLYSDLAAMHPDGQVRNMLETLAAQEMQHKHNIESLYNEVAFPQTDGG